MKFSISVVIPSLNAENFIMRALESVMSQSYQPLEIIVIDNGSTDRTREILEQLDSSKIRVFECKERGSGPARNLGVQLSKGTHIAFLDADDVWHPSKIEKQIIHMSKMNFERAIYGTYATYKTSNLKKVGVTPPTKNDFFASRELVTKGKMPFPTSSWILEKKLFEEIGGFDPKFFTSQDFEFLTRAVSQGVNLRVFRSNLLDYQISSESESATSYLKQFLTASFVLDSRKHRFNGTLEDYINMYSSPKTKIGRGALSGKFFRRALVAFGQEQYMRACCFTVASCLLSPKKILTKIIIQGPWKIKFQRIDY